MGSYSDGRVVFLARSLGIVQSVRSAALIGEGVAAPANGSAVSDFKPTEYDELSIILKATFAYTGGTTNPTLQVRLQRKFAPDLADSDDAAWEDMGAFAALTANNESFLRFGIISLITSALETTLPEDVIERDNLGAALIRLGALTEKLRIRETVSGGNRTGGAVTYDLRLFGVKTG